jgi:hypothetical protein
MATSQIQDVDAFKYSVSSSPKPPIKGAKKCTQKSAFLGAFGQGRKPSNIGTFFGGAE